MNLRAIFWLAAIFVILVSASYGQAPDASKMVDDKKARALIEAGDARFAAGELPAALDLYKSMLDRYPASRWRFLAHLKLGKQYLKEKKFDLALEQFRLAAVADNPDQNEVADASLEVGRCYFEMGKFEDAFTELRNVIKAFPGTPYSNDAYYYIGQAHFKLGRYGNAIDAFKNVGTSIDPTTPEAGKLDAGKRLFVKVEDRDLSADAGSAGISATIQTQAGDKETVICLPVAPGSPILMGSLRTQLGDPTSGDGVVQVVGNDVIKVSVLDKQTADAKLNVERDKKIQVVGNARVSIVDGAYAEPIGAVVLDKPAFLLVQDSDRDASGKADSIEVVVRTKRLIDQPATNEGAVAKTTDSVEASALPTAPQYQTIDEKRVKLIERSASEGTPNATVHTGAFGGTIRMVREGQSAEGALAAAVGDLLEIEYLDEVSLEEKPVVRKATAKVIEGNLNPLQVANAQIADEELKMKTALKTSEALKNIGSIYKELGLMKQATEKFQQALTETERVAKEYGKLNQKLLEQTYVQMWKIYYAMDDLPRAAQMCIELQRRFPQSAFVDEALMLMGQVSQKQGKYQDAIGVFNRLAALKNSPQAPAAQFAIGECYEAMGTKEKNRKYYDQAFTAFQACYEKFPNSNQAGNALSKMAEYYYSKEDFNRAIDLYEEALTKYQDSKFLDVVLYNYGRCLVKMKQLPEAQEKFNQLISTYPNSPLVANAQKLVGAIQKRVGGGGGAESSAN